MDSREQIGLNFIRPDVNRPGNFDFVNHSDWLADQFQQIGVKWNRLAFSWVLLEPEPNQFNWEPYDRAVEACQARGIEILATLGGHFDRPPVPAWAGESLHQVVTEHPEYLERFIEAWVKRYSHQIKYWEMLNEPAWHHVGLTVMEYVERILKPGYRIVKSIDPQGIVLPCAYHHLPKLGNREDFWDAARGFYDIHNLHIYVDWNIFRTQTLCESEVREASEFRKLMEKHNEADKAFWITEIGWWGTGSLTGSLWDIYKRDPISRIEFKPAYTGKETLQHPVILREDEKRAAWMKGLFPRLLAIDGCAKVFLWVSVDEFEGGFDPDGFYGHSTPEQPAKMVDLWGIIGGDRKWRKSAFALQEMLKP